MCGLCGYSGNAYDEEIIKKMMDRIKHRGPDSTGVYSDDFATLGFCRLSIVGLEDGHQPIYNEDKSVVITFNGEIYNYKELKEMLIGKGHKFYTHSDTEVIVHLYEEYKEGLVDHLRGMFAIVLYDKEEQKLLMIRDHFGIKPLYYYQYDGGIMFGSEIKSFLEHPDFVKEFNEKSLEDYLTFQYSVGEETFFKGVKKLTPGHMIVFKDGVVTKTRYFDPTFKQENLTFEQSKEKLETALKNSIELHKMSSDVEVGSFLSSGVDSSYIAKMSDVDKTFTVGFDNEKYNEISFAKQLADEIKVENISKVISKEEYFEILPTIQYHMDEPLADPSAVALYFVSNIASKNVKVAMSGEGADELFGGYNIYKETIDLKPIKNLPGFIKKIINTFASKLPDGTRGKNYLIRGTVDIEKRFIGNAKMFSVEERKKILKNPKYNVKPENITQQYYGRVKEEDDLTKMQYIDINMWLAGDILLKADKMSMANSLEVRVPILDKVVFEEARKVPYKLRVSKEGTKLVFRDIARACLPERVSSKKKLGFPVPIRVWLKEDLYYSKVRKSFESDVAKKYFDVKEIVKILDDHKNGKVDNSRKVWTIYSFLVWHETFFA